MKKIYLGAGKDRKEGFIHLDKFPFLGIDVVADVTKGLPFEDSSVDEVFTQDLLEHLPPESKVFVINEIWRVLRNGGIMEHWVPNAGTKNDFGSPTHLSHWNLQQFEHFNVDSYRWGKDHEYEGITSRFKKVVAELTREKEGIPPQSIHVIYLAVK